MREPMSMGRRWVLQHGLGAWAGVALAPVPAWADAALPTIHPDRRLRFPQDFGAHPAARTEWWYLTGGLWPAPQGRDAASSARPDWGFQLTFFRSRTDLAAGSRSAFAPRQLILSHAGLTDVQGQRLMHAQQLARAGFGVAAAAEGDTDVQLREAHLRRHDGAPLAGDRAVHIPEHAAAPSVYDGEIRTPDFRLQLRARTTQSVMLQGQAGYSRKGPQAAQASHYYSQPQLAVDATLSLAGQPTRALAGRAWLDHEWSDSVLAAQAMGWDWIGMNLDDGSALMAFRIRDHSGGVWWAGAGWRSPGGAVQAFPPEAVRWMPQQRWHSPHTGADYPVAWRVQVGERVFTVQALVPDQEMDARSSTGTAYWEGLSALLDAQGRRVGWGYLEMTGYAGTLRL